MQVVQLPKELQGKDIIITHIGGVKLDEPITVKGDERLWIDDTPNAAEREQGSKK